jgi:hypothetical protein
MYNRGGPVKEACGHCAYWKDIRTDQTRFSAVPGVGFDDPTGAVKVLYQTLPYSNIFEYGIEYGRAQLVSCEL